MDSDQIDWLSSYELGFGVKSDGTLGGSPFQDLALPTPTMSPQGSPSVKVTYVSDSSSYADLLNVGGKISGAYKAGLVSVGLSAEASYLKQECGNSQSLDCVASSHWTSEARTFDEGCKFNLTKDVRAHGPSQAHRIAT